MIPRLKPWLGLPETRALLGRCRGGAVEQFEAAFAATMDADAALAFPYGRSALWALFKALGIENAEIIMPAYTCVVVAHATVLSGNIPRFVDITLDDYNMNLDQVEAAINEATRAIVATHLFGYPLNVDRLGAIVQAAEARHGHKIWVIQDCAHSFGAHWLGKPVCNEGDAALFGLGISKMITSIFGGMLTSNNARLIETLREWRDSHFRKASAVKPWLRRLYLLAVCAAFDERLYGLVHWLQEKTPLLDRLTKAYHLDDKIHFPPDYLDRMLDLEAQVGLAQLQRYAEIIRRRRDNAHYYNDALHGIDGLALPPLVDGAAYSHYVVRVPDRELLLRALQSQGVQLGRLIEYSVPHMAAYSHYAGDGAFPTSLLCSEHMVNLPVHAQLKPDQRKRIVNHIIRAVRTTFNKA